MKLLETRQNNQVLLKGRILNPGPEEEPKPPRPSDSSGIVPAKTALDSLPRLPHDSPTH